MQATINFQKGLMPLYCLGLMVYFNNFSRGAWLYFTLHGSYGVLWILGYLIFPNKGFSHNITIAGCINSYLTVLGPYCLAAYLVNSRQIEEAQDPSAERTTVATVMFIFGVICMMGADAQKHFVTTNKPGLITDGWVKYNRNTNYFGEIMLYASFNVVAQSNVVWIIYACIWGLYFSLRMVWKDYQLSRKDGWEEYRRRTWMILFKVGNSDILTVLFYSAIGGLIYFVYSQGGVEATLKSIFKLD